jgi:hypothetical protein
MSHHGGDNVLAWIMILKRLGYTFRLIDGFVLLFTEFLL